MSCRFLAHLRFDLMMFWHKVMYVFIVQLIVAKGDYFLKKGHILFKVFQGCSQTQEDDAAD